MSWLKQIIASSLDGNAVRVGEAVANEMNTRIETAKETIRMEVAQKMFGESAEVVEEEDDAEELNEELLTTLATIFLVGKLLPVAIGATLIAVGGASYALLKIVQGGEKLKNAIEDAKRKADSSKVRAATESLKKAEEVSKDPKRGGMLKRLADQALSVIKRQAKQS